MGEGMNDVEQLQVRQTIRDAIVRYRARETSLGDLLRVLDPVVDEVQPEETWEQVSDSYNELDAFYGLIATSSGDAAQPDVLSEKQQRNVDRILSEIDQLIS